MVISQIAIFAALITFVLSLGAEFLHVKRCNKLAHLAFGPNEKPRLWTKFAPLLRVFAMTSLVWGFTVLYLLPPKASVEREIKESEYRRVVLLLDVSPSMQIQDGGIPQGSDSSEQQTRAQRGAEVMESILQRLYQDEIRFTVVAFYTEARTIVEDTKDPEILLNIMRDLPLVYAFKGGKTDIMKGIKHTFELAKDWPEQSATVIMVSDGDTIPSTGMPKMPKSISRFLVVGVGNISKGSLVYDHLSRQNASKLRELSNRLGGEYQNVNNKQLSTTLIDNLIHSARGPEKTKRGMREYAKLAILVGAIILSVLPLLLEKFGSQWIQSRTQTQKL